MEDLWVAGAEADLQTSAVELGVLEVWRAVEVTSYTDLVTRSGICPVLSPIQIDCPSFNCTSLVELPNSVYYAVSPAVLRMTVVSLHM